MSAKSPESKAKPAAKPKKAAPAPKPQKAVPAAPKQPAPAPLVVPLTPDEERTWAMLAHLSVLLNLVTGFLGVAAALVIYLIYQTRSRYVAYQALQSLILQSIVWVGGGIITVAAWVVTGMLMAVLVGFLCLPVTLLISAFPIAAIVYGIVGGIQCSQGEDFRYWLVGDWVRSTLTG